MVFMFEPKSRFVLAINIPSFIICFNALVYFRAGEILARAMFFFFMHAVWERICGSK